MKAVLARLLDQAGLRRRTDGGSARSSAGRIDHHASPGARASSLGKAARAAPRSCPASSSASDLTSMRTASRSSVAAMACAVGLPARSCVAMKLSMACVYSRGERRRVSRQQPSESAAVYSRGERRRVSRQQPSESAAVSGIQSLGSGMLEAATARTCRRPCERQAGSRCRRLSSVAGACRRRMECATSSSYSILGRWSGSR